MRGGQEIESGFFHKIKKLKNPSFDILINFAKTFDLVKNTNFDLLKMLKFDTVS